MVKAADFKLKTNIDDISSSLSLLPYLYTASLITRFSLIFVRGSILKTVSLVYRLYIDN